jgi:hypothetical protein
MNMKEFLATSMDELLFVKGIGIDNSVAGCQQ